MDDFGPAGDVDERGGVGADGSNHGADPRPSPYLLADVVHPLPRAVHHVRQRPASRQGGWGSGELTHAHREGTP